MDDGLYLEKYRVATTRKSGYDYSQAGQYFITICTQNRTPYFGHIQPAGSALQDAYLIGSDLAARALECWQEMPKHFSFVEAADFIVIPDHVHGILVFHRPMDKPDQPAPVFGPQSDNLASVVRGFKVGVKAWATKHGHEFAWQARYFDRVIRNERELEKISAYIRDNPNRWETDRVNDSGLFCRGRDAIVEVSSLLKSEKKNGTPVRSTTRLQLLRLYAAPHSLTSLPPVSSGKAPLRQTLPRFSETYTSARRLYS